MKKKNPVRGGNGRFAKKKPRPFLQPAINKVAKKMSEKIIKDYSAALSCITHPPHYISHPSGIECIQIFRHMTANLAAVLKYIWRTDRKNGAEDLEKAIWYLADEIDRVRGESDKPDAFGEYIKQSIASYYAVKNNGNG